MYIFYDNEIGLNQVENFLKLHLINKPKNKPYFTIVSFNNSIIGIIKPIKAIFLWSDKGHNSFNAS